MRNAQNISRPADFEVLPIGTRSLLERIEEALRLPRGPIRDAMLEAVRGELARLTKAYFGR